MAVDPEEQLPEYWPHLALAGLTGLMFGEYLLVGGPVLETLRSAIYFTGALASLCVVIVERHTDVTPPGRIQLHDLLGVLIAVLFGALAAVERAAGRPIWAAVCTVLALGFAALALRSLLRPAASP